VAAVNRGRRRPPDPARDRSRARQRQAWAQRLTPRIVRTHPAVGQPARRRNPRRRIRPARGVLVPVQSTRMKPWQISTIAGLVVLALLIWARAIALLMSS